MILSEALYRSETLWIEYYYTPERPNKRLAFVFSSLGSKILNQNINGGDYLIENGFDIVNFNSSRTDWFQSVPADVFAAIAKIDRAQITSSGSQWVLDGGIRGDRLLQVSGMRHGAGLFPANDITIRSDPRFAGHIENIESVYPISADAIADACRFFVVYDNKDLYDKMHAERLKSIIPAERLR